MSIAYATCYTGGSYNIFSYYTKIAMLYFIKTCYKPLIIALVWTAIIYIILVKIQAKTWWYNPWYAFGAMFIIVTSSIFIFILFIGILWVQNL